MTFQRVLGSGKTTSRTGGSRAPFSTATPQVPDNTSEAKTGFAAITSGLGQVGRIIGEALPVFAASELRMQQQDQLRDPTFDQRSARNRVGQVETTAQNTTQRPAGATGSNLIPGVSNGALVFGVVLLISGVVIVRSI